MKEDDIEQLAIGLFENLGYGCLNGADIAPDGQRPERDSYQSVLLKNRLVDALAIINPSFRT